MTKPSVKTNNNLRADAALVLYQILEQGKSARECLPTSQLRHTDQNKAWLQEMVFGVLRQLPILQYWLRLLLETPLKNKFKVAEHLILLGFYQIAFSRVSQHAAVSETVEACKPLKIDAMRGLINAILRNFIRLDVQHNLPDDAQVLSGLPKWLYKKLSTAYPDDLTDIIHQIESKAPLWLRVNTKNISHADFLGELDKQAIEYSLSSLHVEAVILSKGADIISLPGFAQGWFAVQDGAAQLAAHYLAPKPNEHILDCCAAPGGKTCHILELSESLHLTALEIDNQRMTKVSENLLRLGHSAQLILGDASRPSDWWDGRPFDRILLDAPCSATGIIRRHPDIKWLRKAKDIDALVLIQQQILDAMWPLLKPGGVMLYATCSILPEENHQQIDDFLARTNDAQLDLQFKHDDIHCGQQILPGNQQMDGFYYCRLIKSAQIND
ncbi:16S rRNA (cytosine(967)-C(5))-methyltransferase RsmB [Paraglaciecola sp.]|uniref:16S rRNA (cytosine(967)-C(5))-methyltransferase RsmB n=1 Tax=Paraglaciecola sp. TaxID=1920173 RepID=UPI0030F465B0